jgi:hypothetical protein
MASSREMRSSPRRQACPSTRSPRLARYLVQAGLISEDKESIPSHGLELSQRIKPMLAGLSPQVQGTALADLVSIFLAGHRPDVREEAFARWIKLVRDLLPLSEKQMFPNGKPDGWE